MNGLPRWDHVVTQLRIIPNWLITAIQWMVHWWVLVYCGRVLTRGLHYFIKQFQSWAVWKHNITRGKSAKHPAAIIFPLVKFWAHSTENFNPPQLWHMLCTILEVPLGSFLSTFNHDHLPSCSSVWHKCKEPNGLILPSLRFCIQELPTNFYQGQFPCWACCRASIALVVELLLPAISSNTCIGFRGSMQQQEYSSSNCHMQFISHIIMSFMWNLVCLKHQNLGSMSLKALVVSWIFDLE